jgi:LysM repeat protein
VRRWTKSACVVLAWSILIIVVAVGMKGPARPVQANIRIASSTSSTSSTSSSSGINVTLAGALSVAAVTAASPAAGYVVQPGDTLSGIAARLGVRGGWPALYAANRRVIGPDPDVIGPGTVLVLPGRRAPARYTVVSGDTLAGIAAALGVRGGWPALYAANRRVIGPDPDVIRPGTVLTVARPAAPSPAGTGPGRPRYPVPPPAAAPAGSGHRPAPARTSAPGAGMPPWLKTMLVAVGLLIGAAFLTEPALVLRRRRRQAAARDRDTLPPAAPDDGAPRAAGLRAAGSGQGPGCGRLAPQKARVVLADYDRVVVTHSPPDGKVYVLRPPGQDPKAIMRAARLVLPEDLYRELAGQLGLPASWPIVLADYDRVVVTHSPPDGMVYVLRPPGEDPRAILRAARLVLPEGPYEELADQLGVPAGWPAG